MKRNHRIYFALALALLLCLCACEKSPAPIPPSPSPAVIPDTPAPPPLLPKIDSSTARIPITDAIYKLFTESYGYEGPAPICSKTHQAWLNLADGTADIVFLVAPTMDELRYFAEKNVDIEMKVYGYDGLVFIGNESNPVWNLTSGEIRDIYSGNITNWSDIGGENSDIIVYIRNQESGSQRLFESLVWAGYDMPDFAAMDFHEQEIDPAVTQRMEQISVDDDMSTITENVLRNQYAIGFNIMSYLDHTFAGSSLKLFAVDGYLPTTENFASGQYPFLTTSYVAIRLDEPEGSPARALFDWVGSEESRDLIAQNSTLTVAFTEPVVILAGESFSAPNPAPLSKQAVEALIPLLNTRYFVRTDFLPYSLEELGYLRNGIYAISGKIFKTQKYAEFFGAQSWYSGRYTKDADVAQRFNAYQIANLKVLLAIENELRG